MFEKSFLVDFGHYFYMYERFEENKQKKLTLESSIKMMLDAISFITQSEDPLAREVTDLFCCISACAHYINTEHSVLASNNNGIDWHKLTCLKRELMFEPTLNRHRSRPIEQKDERFPSDRTSMALVLQAVPDIIAHDLPLLKHALQNMSQDRRQYQTIPINIRINRLVEYGYDESLLKILEKDTSSFNQNYLEGRHEPAKALYQLIRIGEAVNQLSPYMQSQLPYTLKQKLIFSRHILCHAERAGNRAIIDDLLQGNLKNEIININELLAEFPEMFKALEIIFKRYELDNTDKSLEDPLIKTVWNRTANEEATPPTKKDSLLYEKYRESISSKIKQYTTVKITETDESNQKRIEIERQINTKREKILKIKSKYSNKKSSPSVHDPLFFSGSNGLDDMLLDGDLTILKSEVKSLQSDWDALSKISKIPYLNRLILAFKEASNSTTEEVKQFYCILAGSYCRGIFDYSDEPFNKLFVDDLKQVIVDCGPPAGQLNLFEALLQFSQGMRGHLAHLRQARIGEAKCWDLLRWPYRESDLHMQVIFKCIEPLQVMLKKYLSLQSQHQLNESDNSGSDSYDTPHLL